MAPLAALPFQNVPQAQSAAGYADRDAGRQMSRFCFFEMDLEARAKHCLPYRDNSEDSLEPDVRGGISAKRFQKDVEPLSFHLH